MKYIFVYVFPVLMAITVKAQTTPNADAVLKEAYARAASENKKVMVIFRASWCNWCEVMDVSINDPSVKGFFDNNYVITHLTVFETKNKTRFENPGAEELNKKWRGSEQGLPFWVILDKDGVVLANSIDKSNDNVGCTGTTKEVQYFLQVLKKTSSINSQQAAAVAKRFGKNE